MTDLRARSEQPETGQGLRARTMRLPLALAGVGIASLVLLYVRDPHVSGSYGYCPFHALTGLWDLGDGGMRAVNDLTHLRIGSALSSNLMAVALVVFVGVAYLRWLPRRWRGEWAPLVRLGPRTVTVLVTVLVVFTVVRNTPLGAWLAP